MKVKHFRVQNFTSLIDIDLTNLPDLVVFIGKNSSGKSNLIDALALLLTNFDTEVIRSLGNLESYHHLFPNHNTQASQSPQIAATITLTPEEWARLLSAEENKVRGYEQKEIHLARRITADNDEAQWAIYTVRIGNVEIVSSGEVVENDPIIEPVAMQDNQQIDVNSDQVPIRDDLQYEFEINPVQFVSQLGELLESSFEVIHTTEGRRSWTDRFTERPTIIEADEIRDLWSRSQSKGNQRQTWTRTTQRYRKMAPNDQQPAGVDSSIQMEEGSLSVPIGMTGEGSQAVLRLINQLERGPSIMAIEEPETHLHPALTKRVGQLLTETTTRNKQLFICTHSPFLISPSSLDSFFVVRNGSNGTQVSPMGDKKGLRNLLLDIGMRPSDILFCDAILLVEGLADEIFFNALSNKIDVPLAGRHVKIVKTNGSSRGKYKVEFWAEVGRDAGIPLYIILDKNAREEVESAIAKAQILSDCRLILAEGDLEDCYPWAALKQALLTRFNKDVEEPIHVGERVKELRSLLNRQGPRNQWKPILAEEVAQIVTRDEAESDMAAIVAFLRKIYNEVGAE